MGEDIEIVVTGLRPGEKLYEELNLDDEPTMPTANEAITVITGSRPEVDTVDERLSMLQNSLKEDDAALRRALQDAVPTYRPQSK